MNRYMMKNYTLLGKEVKKNDKLTKTLRRIIKNPSLQYLVFAVIMCVLGYLMAKKVLPYSWQTPMATTLAYSIASIGFCLLMGYSGLASLGTGGFIGIGTYSVHYIMVESGLPFLAAILVAIAVAVVIGLIVGFISLRIEGIYLVILTLALSEILRKLYGAIEAKISVSTKGVELFGIRFPRTSAIMLVSIFLFIVMVATTNLINSPTGRAMLAMKNSTAAAQAMGINLIKYRLIAFIICTAYAALAGTLLLVVNLSASAEDVTGYYSLITSLNILVAVIVGGYKSLWGAIIGTFIMTDGFNNIVLQNGSVKEFLGNISSFIPGLDADTLILLLQGVLVILIVMFYPGGLAQLVLELKTKLKALYKKMKEAKYGKDLG